MKRVILSFFLALLLISPSSVSALGIDPVVSAVKTGDDDGAKLEYVSIFNNSDSNFDLTNWCVYYASASDITKTKLVCFEPPDNQTKLFLEPFSYLNLSTQEFADSVEGFTPDFMFDAGISATGGHIRLMNPDGDEIDKLGWGTAISPETAATAEHQLSNMLARLSVPSSQYLQDTNNNFNDFTDISVIVLPISGLVEQPIIKDFCPNIEGLQDVMPDDYLLDEYQQCQQDQCDNLDGLQVDIPVDHESLDGENCTEKILILESSILTITELLPNVDGSDAGNEYIEIHNPNERDVDISGYKLDLGPAYSKSHTFASQILKPLSFVVFNDILTRLTLSNSTPMNVRLTAPDGTVVSQTDSYENPKEDEAWALIDDDWQYTNRPTPGASNLADYPVVVMSSTVGDNELTPCSPGKERNPETNRCRNIVSASNSLVACKSGQERNPETNRCRNIVTASATLTPCKEGQERNPTTNRCRKIDSAVAGVAKADVQDVPSKISSPKNWLVYGTIAGVVIVYALYEWRNEIFKLLARRKN